jgi:hypothetical protein
MACYVHIVKNFVVVLSSLNNSIFKLQGKTRLLIAAGKLLLLHKEPSIYVPYCNICYCPMIKIMFSLHP